MSSTSAAGNSGGSSKVWSIRFLLFIAGLGGLLYGIDVGIIAGALPYLEATAGLDAQQLSFIVAAVLLGGVISTLFAGMLSDLLGRKTIMAVSGLLFVASIPTIALADGYLPLILGRLLQGISAGLIGVVVPLYLAECLSASTRGKGTGIFQWLLTLGIVAAALIAIFFSMWLDGVKALGDAEKLMDAKDLAWRSIFWVSLPPGVLFVLGSLLVPESPRWLFRRGRFDAARAALLRTRSDEDAAVEFREMEETAAAEKAKSSSAGKQAQESLLHRKYVIPFILACIILACNQLTGVNSIIAYYTNILIQAGLSDVQAHWGYVIFTTVNFLVTMVGVMLVDRKGRKFLLSLGSAGIIASLVCVGFVFQQTEKSRVDCKTALETLAEDYQDVKVTFDQSAASSRVKGITLTLAGNVVTKASAGDKKVALEFDRNIADAKIVKDEKKKSAKVQLTFVDNTGGKGLSFDIDSKFVASADAEGKTLTLGLNKGVSEVKLGEKDRRIIVTFDQARADSLLAAAGETGKAIMDRPATMVVIYSVGDFSSATNAVRSDDPAAKAVEIKRGDCLPSSAVAAFFKNPFASLAASQAAPLKIENALITPVPSAANGWLTAFFTLCFMAFFAVGPGVCVWLALSELMPTRIRSNGMSIALLINIAVSTAIAGIFLPTVGKYGYGTMFYSFAAATVIYFITATFFLPETKGKTLEEIEEHFSGHAKGK
jgi:sugar porter (SP) family MFS transporter